MLKGTKLTVTATDENGQPTGQLPDDAQPSYRGKQLAVNSQAKLSFTYKAGTTPGVATIRIYVDYGKSATIPQNLLGQVQITLTNP
ncbi:MAG: hypothetical protein EHM45_10740 [Desulfobacteraceae bacterium]|nr:MAG: hypothetical protein EHM45_10740 [Desulfobacteraceae bacterium]